MIVGVGVVARIGHVSFTWVLANAIEGRLRQSCNSITDLTLQLVVTNALQVFPGKWLPLRTIRMCTNPSPCPSFVRVSASCFEVVENSRCFRKSLCTSELIAMAKQSEMNGEL